jgi:hypothetical protein
MMVRITQDGKPPALTASRPAFDTNVMSHRFWDKRTLRRDSPRWSDPGLSYLAHSECGVHFCRLPS